MKAASLDTNILLRWILQDVPGQTAIVEHLLAQDRAYQIADAAISEFVYVCEKGGRLPRPLIAEFVAGIMSQANLNCNRALFSRVLPLYQEHPALSFVDCCLAVYAELNDSMPLYTFDKKLANQLSQTEQPA